MIEFEEAYKIAERMAKPWQWSTSILALTVAGLLTYLLLSETATVAEISAEDLQAASINSITSIEEK